MDFCTYAAGSAHLWVGICAEVYGVGLLQIPKAVRWLLHT